MMPRHNIRNYITILSLLASQIATHRDEEKEKQCHNHNHNLLSESSCDITSSLKTRSSTYTVRLPGRCTRNGGHFCLCCCGGGGNGIVRSWGGLWAGISRGKGAAALCISVTRRFRPAMLPPLEFGGDIRILYNVVSHASVQSYDTAREITHRRGYLASDSASDEVG